MKNIYFLPIILSFFNAISQTAPSKEYFTFIQKADSFYFIKDYKNSHLNYSYAFSSNNDIAYVIDRYNSACSWALDKNVDSAFFQLYRIATKGNFKNYLGIINDEDLKSLHNDKRWQLLLEIIKNNMFKTKHE